MGVRAMKRRVSRALVLGIVVAVVVCVTAVAFWDTMLTHALCKDEMLLRRRSSNGRHVAVVVRRNCGAGSSFSTMIFIDRWNILFDRPTIAVHDEAGVDMKWV